MGRGQGGYLSGDQGLSSQPHASAICYNENLHSSREQRSSEQHPQAFTSAAKRLWFSSTMTKRQDGTIKNTGESGWITSSSCIIHRCMKHWRNRTFRLWYHFPASEIIKQAIFQTVIQMPVSRHKDFRSGWLDPLVHQNCEHTMNPEKMVICQMLKQAAILHGVISSNTEITHLLGPLPVGLEDVALITILKCLTCLHR